MPFELNSPSEQVAAHLRTEILNGRWRTEFPGTPALSMELEVDRKTVTSAIHLLEQEGLVVSQGPGRPRLVTKTKRTITNRLNIRFIVHEDDDRQRAHVMDLIPRVQQLGHHIELDRKTLSGLGMSLQRIKKHVAANPADAWILLAASQEVLEWFAKQNIPAMAMFGRRRGVNIASVGPDKEPAMRECVRRLVELGHRRIVLLAREERRHPTLGHLETAFLDELQKQGIAPGHYHLPHWKDEPLAFHECMHRLFEHTPPTALILDEAQFYVAALQHLTQLGLRSPTDVSLISCDTHPVFAWCIPSVSHIHWSHDPVVKHIAHWVRQVSHGVHDKTTSFTPAMFMEGGSIGPAVNKPDPR